LALVWSSSRFFLKLGCEGIPFNLMRIGFRNTKLSFTKHWGADKSASIIRYFRAVGHNVANSVRKVIGLGIPTSSQEENKGHYPNLDDFQEVYKDSMLIHHGEMMALILHGFVPSSEAPEHVRTLGDLFRYNSTMLRTCSSESRMALFGHKFCHGDLTVDRSIPFCSQDGCSFKKIILLFPHGAQISFLQVPAHRENNVRNKGTWSQDELEESTDAGRQNLCRRTCVRSPRRGSKNWIAFSPRSCHLERLKWEEVVSQPWRSRRIITPHRILTRTWPIL
jgi:transposase